MDIPEELRGLVDELGEALVRALADDANCRSLTHAIQAAGYDLALSLEATVSPHFREESFDEDGVAIAWSQEDEALLRTFRIAPN